MKTRADEHGQDHLESVCLYALQALPAHEVQAVEAQIAACADCRSELKTLRPALDALVDWPTDVLRPTRSLWERLAGRISTETGEVPLPAPPARPQPEWEEVAPGISCRLLAADEATGMVGMLVKLAPGTEYPPHTHAGLEELHMLEGELLVNDKKLSAGDYLRSEPGTADRRVWSETGCTGVLITSARDRLH
jgi:anti-sigma factor ChrR (cupin superfamily)